ncbi:30S ribosomal protein S17e [Candidatus Woesearchaeota archaeon]|nr:30S ribosomal protein S17e [Candidatus Woesearchaeota archaeon]
MGRIKTALAKRVALKLVREHRSELKDSFEENKKIVDELVDMPSPKIRNIVAGYVTRIIKNKQEI